MSDENVVEKISETLGEKEETPLAEIGRLVDVLGEEKALSLLDETLKIEADGGMLTNDGKKRRSIGGVFFKVVKDQTTPKERGQIFGPSSQTVLKFISWDESKELSTEVLKLEKGEVTALKMNIVGRPGRIIEKGAVVITSMQNSQPPNLPKGMPKPPSDPTTYIIYISMKHWDKVKEAINDNPDDKLVIDGYPMFDKRIGQTGAMTIFALNVTTQQLQRNRREAQRTNTKR